MSLTDAIIKCNMNGCTVAGIGTDNIVVMERKTCLSWAVASNDALIKFVEAYMGGNEK